MLEVRQTAIPEVLVLKPKIFGDDRGFFLETYNENRWADTAGIKTRFVQDNHSGSVGNVLRGLHYQIQHAQGKLIRVVEGTVFDVAVDIRKNSPTFGQWVGEYLSAENKFQLWIPEGFAHGFLVLSEYAQVLYKTTDYYYPEHERCIIWNDPDLAIAWPTESEPILSAKDSLGKQFLEAEIF